MGTPPVSPYSPRYPTSDLVPLRSGVRSRAPLAFVTGVPLAGGRCGRHFSFPLAECSDGSDSERRYSLSLSLALALAFGFAAPENATVNRAGSVGLDRLPGFREHVVDALLHRLAIE